MAELASTKRWFTFSRPPFFFVPVKVGKSTITPGRFMFLRSPMEALFSTRVLTSPAASSQERTVKTREPSATKMVCPGVTEVAKVAYEQANLVLSPLKE